MKEKNLKKTKFVDLDNVMDCGTDEYDVSEACNDLCSAEGEDAYDVVSNSRGTLFILAKDEDPVVEELLVKKSEVKELLSEQFHAVLAREPTAEQIESFLDALENKSGEVLQWIANLALKYANSIDWLEAKQREANRWKNVDDRPDMATVWELVDYEPRIRVLISKDGWVALNSMAFVGTAKHFGGSAEAIAAKMRALPTEKLLKFEWSMIGVEDARL